MKSYKNITEYMKDVPKEHQGYMKIVRELVRKLVPKGEEVIRYGMPTMQIGGKNLLHFAAMKSHYRLFQRLHQISIQQSIAYRSHLQNNQIPCKGTKGDLIYNLRYKIRVALGYPF